MRAVRSSSRVCPSMYWSGGMVSQHALAMGCITACIGQAGCVSHPALDMGVSAQGVSARGCQPRGVSVGGCLPGWCASHHALRQTPP